MKRPKLPVLLPQSPPDDAPESPPEENREDRLTRRVTWWVEGPLVTVMLAILIYYGGNSGPNGDSSYIDHGLWQDAVFWPVVIIGFVLLIIDRTGRKRPPKAERQAMREAERAMPKAERRTARAARHQPARRISRWVAQKIIARQDRRRRERGIYLPRTRKNSTTRDSTDCQGEPAA